MPENDHNIDESMTAAEAGKMGGEKVLDERGVEFYSEIASRHEKNSNPGNFSNRDEKEVQEAGRKGGEARGGNESEDTK